MTYPPSPDLGSGLRLFRLDRAHKGNDRVEIAGRHLDVPVVRHWSRQFRAVRSNALGDRLLDIVVAPLADTLLGISGDIAADARRDLTETREFAPTRIGEAHIERLPVPGRRVAQDAMPDIREIAAIDGFIGGQWFLDVCNWGPVARRQRDFVLRSRERVLEWFQAAQIGGDGFRIVVRQLARRPASALAGR
jgi:hypothetical protein